MSKFISLTTQDYNTLINNATTLEEDGFGPKVYSLNNGNILKLFRRKSLISSAVFYPYSLKFANNAKKLKTLDIKTVKIKQLYKVPHIKRTAVEYFPLEGESVRDLIKKNEITNEIIAKLAEYFSILHNKGIYFRSAHFGNILYTPQKDFGLIDMSDMKIYKNELSLWHRVRNFRHIFKYKKDKNIVLKYSIDEFVEHYLIQSKVFKKDELKQVLMKIIKN